MSFKSSISEPAVDCWCYCCRCWFRLAARETYLRWIIVVIVAVDEGSGVVAEDFAQWLVDDFRPFDRRLMQQKRGVFFVARILRQRSSGVRLSTSHTWKANTRQKTQCEVVRLLEIGWINLCRRLEKKHVAKKRWIWSAIYLTVFMNEGLKISQHNGW